jgi:formimidoylglutamate deiminase
VPAMPNVHSHAFQRALAGRTGAAGPSRDDSFWTWRQAMYAFLDHLDPDAFTAICAQAYVEMVRAGYATVAEFHYVHHDPAGRPYANRAELAQRVVAAAKEAGIGLTLLPVLYAHAGFGGMPTVAGQRRFVHTGPSFARLYEQLASDAAGDGYVLGIAPHSLRAVTPDELRYVIGLAGTQTPLHIHAAEQTKEVDACYAWSGMRPVEWLLAHAGVDPRWCIVHATHMTAAETRDLATTGAVAALAPTTEADLGDGTFPGEAYLAHDGRFGVGSDSNTQVDPFAELRQLEWSQRVRARRRLIMTTDAEATVGTALWSRAARGGAQAVAPPPGALEVGPRAGARRDDRGPLGGPRRPASAAGRSVRALSRRAGAHWLTARRCCGPSRAATARSSSTCRTRERISQAPSRPGSRPRVSACPTPTGTSTVWCRSRRRQA